jgi:hypothetical protein
MRMTLLLLAGIAASITLSAQSGGRSGMSRETLMDGTKTIGELLQNPILFTKGKFQLAGNDANNDKAAMTALAQSDAIIKEYQGKMDAFLKEKTPAVLLKNAYTKVLSNTNGIPFAIKAVAEGTQSGKNYAFLLYVQDLYLYEAYLSNMVKVYPESIALQEKLENIQSAIQQYGNKDAFMAKMQQNKLDYLKSLKLSKAGMTDAKLEKTIKDQYEKWFEEAKLSVTKVVITSTVWTLEKNVLDIPLHREIAAQLAIKKPDGSCGIAYTYVRETYLGGGQYSAPTVISPTGPTIIPCENLNK